jgi:hypothetical protein
MDLTYFLTYFDLDKAKAMRQISAENIITYNKLIRAGKNTDSLSAILELNGCLQNIILAELWLKMDERDKYNEAMDAMDAQNRDESKVQLTELLDKTTKMLDKLDL